MQNALINLGIENEYREALIKIGFQLETLYSEEVYIIIVFFIKKPLLFKHLSIKNSYIFYEKFPFKSYILVLTSNNLNNINKKIKFNFS